MTTKSEFNAEEWDRVERAPALAALMVILSDRGGVIRESIALGKVYAEARRDGGSELMKELVATPPGLNPTEMGPADQLRTQLPQRVEEAFRTVEEKATPEEAREYRDFILRAADVVAHAAEEQAVLDELSGKLAASSS